MEDGEGGGKAGIREIEREFVCERESVCVCMCVCVCVCVRARVFVFAWFLLKTCPIFEGLL